MSKYPEPPHHIVLAAEIVRQYFVAQGIKDWELCGLVPVVAQPQEELSIPPGWEPAPGVEADINKRWEDGMDHHPKSERAFKALRHLDETFCGDSFCFKAGGDGDNGETLMYGLDIFFESQDALRQPVAGEPHA